MAMENDARCKSENSLIYVYSQYKLSMQRSLDNLQVTAW